MQRQLWNFSDWCVVLRSPTAFFCLTLGGEKESGPVSMDRLLISNTSNFCGGVNEFQHPLPIIQLNKQWSRMLADSNIGPQALNLWVWWSANVLEFINTPIVVGGVRNE